jgi:hypothetical protein
MSEIIQKYPKIAAVQLAISKLKLEAEESQKSVVE